MSNIPPPNNSMVSQSYFGVKLNSLESWLTSDHPRCTWSSTDVGIEHVYDIDCKRLSFSDFNNLVRTTSAVASDDEPIADASYHATAAAVNLKLDDATTVVGIAQLATTKTTFARLVALNDDLTTSLNQPTAADTSGSQSLCTIVKTTASCAVTTTTVADATTESDDEFITEPYESDATRCAKSLANALSTARAYRKESLRKLANIALVDRCKQLNPSVEHGAIAALNDANVTTAIVDAAATNDAY